MVAFLLPDWMIGEHYITLATWGLVLVTFLLVLLTGFMWWDSFSKGKEQRDRWKTEDEQRKQDRDEERARWKRDDEIRQLERRPKYQFGLKLADNLPTRGPVSVAGSHVVAELWVANLGVSGLYIDKMFVRQRDRLEAEFEVNRVVSPGDQLSLVIPNSFWERLPGIGRLTDGNYIYGDQEVWLSMADASAEFVTERILHYVMFMSGRICELSRGSYEPRQPDCPKCGVMLNFILPTSGLLTEEEVQQAHWRPMLADLNRTCPNHASSHLESLPSTPEWFTKMRVLEDDYADGADVTEANS